MLWTLLQTRSEDLLQLNTLQIQAMHAVEDVLGYSDFQDDNGGVSESFQVGAISGYRSPKTSPAAAYDSSSAISSGVSFTESAPTFWLKFSIFVVPGMGQTSFPWWWTQANASCDGVQPFLAAIALTRSNIWAFLLRFSGWNRGRCCRSVKFLLGRGTIYTVFCTFVYIKAMSKIHKNNISKMK